MREQDPGFEPAHPACRGVRWDGEIASIEGMGRAAWFKDSEGNVVWLDHEDATA
jgi:hypothetical protein